MTSHTARSPIARLTGRAIGGMPLMAVVFGVSLTAWVALLLVAHEPVATANAASPAVIATFIGIWLIMTVAMMLPSATPMVLAFDGVSRRLADAENVRPISTWIFVTGYLIAWSGYGLLAYSLLVGLAWADLDYLAWDRGGPLAAGLAVAGAGLYQLTPLKQACLTRCRTPLHYILNGWRRGRGGAIRMGVEHGLHCVGCCWAIMLVLLLTGAMSLAWMGIAALLTFAEKVLPVGGRGLSRAIGVVFLGLGAWIALSPATVPGLVDGGLFAPASHHHP